MRGLALSVTVGAASFAAFAVGTIGLVARLMATGLATLDAEDPDDADQWL